MQRTTAAKGPIGRVEYCAEHRCYLLHLGAVTLRFDPGAYEALIDLLIRGYEADAPSAARWSGGAQPPGLC